jgi:DNA-binding winged helix-turn-helix (wHTH) protein
MPEQSPHLVYVFDGWEVDLARGELRARGVPVPLGSRAFQILAVLVQSAGELVTKDELMARVWPGAIVEENKLQVHISAIRKALGTDRGTVKTSFGRGYRLVGDWAIRKESTLADPVGLDPTRMPVQRFLTNVPAAGSELIGRTAAVQRLQKFLSAYRAITLTGPGGIGKTALAMEVARRLFAGFHGDCWLVDLVSLSHPGLVPSTVTGVLGLKLGGDEISAESVARAIGGKRLLLVLDNCEHLVDATARLVETVIRLCPATSVVATSREVLRIEGEHVYRVPPLDVPNQLQEESDIVLGHSAVQLFVARARAFDSAFSPHGENLRAIAAICRRLDGIPLAIEFAATRAQCSDPNWFFPAWMCDSHCWSAGAERRCRGIRRCEQRSTGASSCCLSRNGACCADWVFSLLASRFEHRPASAMRQEDGAATTLNACRAIPRQKKYAESDATPAAASLRREGLELERFTPRRQCIVVVHVSSCAAHASSTRSLSALLNIHSVIFTNPS